MNHTNLETTTDRSVDGALPNRDGGESRDPETNRETTTDADDSTGTDPLSVDDIFDVLSNQRRRETIKYVTQNDNEPVTIRDLAAVIAARENDVSVQEVTYKERKRVYTSLHQLHLDRMNDLGVIRYDKDRGVIEPTTATERFEAYLTSITTDEDENEDARSGIPLAVAACCVVGIVGVVAAWAGPVPAIVAPLFVVPAVFSILIRAYVDARG